MKVGWRAGGTGAGAGAGAAVGAGTGFAGETWTGTGGVSDGVEGGATVLIAT